MTPLKYVIVRRVCFREDALWIWELRGYTRVSQPCHYWYLRLGDCLYGGCPGHWRALPASSSIPRLYLLILVGLPHLPGNQKRIQAWPMTPGVVGKIASGWDHWHRLIQCVLVGNSSTTNSVVARDGIFFLKWWPIPRKVPNRAL